MIYVGAILGGPEVSQNPTFAHAMHGVMFPVPGEPWPQVGRASHPTEPYRERRDPRPVGSLDIVFHVPGSLLKPEHQGLRTGRFSTKERLFQIQIAVPEALMDSPHLRQFILDSIRQAIHLGAPRFAKHKIDYPLAEYLDQVRELESRLAAAAPE
jgi:hypothetical protein